MRQPAKDIVDCAIEAAERSRWEFTAKAYSHGAGHINMTAPHEHLNIAVADRAAFLAFLSMLDGFLHEVRGMQQELRHYRAEAESRKEADNA